jgi:hypothetical protein
MKTLLIVYLGSGGLLILLSLPLLWGKVPPNGLYGFRTRATLHDPVVWYAANHYSAKWMLASGVAWITAALGLYFVPGLSVDHYSFGCLALFAVPFVIGLVLSLRYANFLSRRNR